jgi:hypothetical protein
MPRNRRKPTYDATLRFRAFKALADRIDRIIEKRGYGAPADFMREGMSKLVVEEERRLGLPPLESTAPGKGIAPQKGRPKGAKGAR